ncbi:DHH family phosphoesterase [Tuwongella immobilis]|uniref:DDH domain-containing protein n=1 Tax=Tuwongella immobilis TaxID=692036 RepID=A0A6C2YV02_9BACT|nr:DHH family phosphoesterase [Tuwongella immobilis]VIP05440.1 dhh family phosphoesterase : Exopolyphosphatase-like enzyme OS=Singulisphaera acidiphila (strain ATCC BAA-1392 / DSM 18658 / VKM B-2454 / MOB10) GN=Sinac_3763 PE=4 SV=1: DHH: DHHA1 [Tuwongella immobilis]VTS08236.1 dhh family phosphoesterase : Exopolyphosphatase-like enzyme OS=Singulisphaera acidiphila (strain ATCC BAA-1392 / DSM 18658 / VKM B-2454 / MOB10) GN=Sinac_3763 PE=4 SV=1: DHH: DHHA1 [Tuwongella immobilis]
MAQLGAEPEVVGNRSRLKRSSRFLQSLQHASRVTFVSHVNPDPDSLGSMLGLAHLVETKLGKPTRLTRDGLISRAENRAMVETLKLDLLPIEEMVCEPEEAVVMVDSQPNTGRHSFSANIPLVAVLDHHDTPGDVSHVPFVDIRPSLGATCTLVTRYLMEQGVPIPGRVATALLYGIETEVCGYPSEAGPSDEEALRTLFPLANRSLIAQIRNARLPHSHFECLLQALQSSFIYDRLIISWVDNLPQPEQAAEVADFAIRFERVDWAVCAGVCGDKLVMSVRSSLPDAAAGDMLRTVVGELGKAGGHDRRAGGCIKLTSTSASAIEELQSLLRKRFLKALHIDECRGQRLVKRKQLLENLK